MRLKPGGVLLLLLVGGLIAYFIFKRTMPTQAGTDTTASTNTSRTNEDSSTANSNSANYGGTTTSNAADRREFN